MPRKQRAPWRPRRGLVPALLQHLVHGERWYANRAKHWKTKAKCYGQREQLFGCVFFAPTDA